MFCCGYKIPGFLGSSQDFKEASRGLELLPVFWNGFQSLKVYTKDFDWHLRFCSGFLSGYSGFGVAIRVLKWFLGV